MTLTGPHQQHPQETVEDLDVEGVTGVDPVVGPVVEHARTRRRSGECFWTHQQSRS